MLIVQFELLEDAITTLIFGFVDPFIQNKALWRKTCKFCRTVTIPWILRARPLLCLVTVSFIQAFAIRSIWTPQDSCGHPGKRNFKYGGIGVVQSEFLLVRLHETAIEASLEVLCFGSQNALGHLEMSTIDSDYENDCVIIMKLGVICQNELVSCNSTNPCSGLSDASEASELMMITSCGGGIVMCVRRLGAKIAVRIIVNTTRE